jgi:hypothetical protein
MLRRVGILLLTFAFVVGLTTQLVPRALAMDYQTPCPMGMEAMGDMPMDQADTSADVDPSGSPCKGLTPDCIDAMGCVVAVAALPHAPISASTAFKWVDVAYSFVTPSLAGRSIPPDLFPPIPLA